LWGEHGKGVRSEYAPRFFGELYPALQRIKAAFDPYNQLNPGKIATPAKSSEAIAVDRDPELLAIDGVALRGELDRTIDERAWQAYDAAVYCNGNGACYNYDVDDPMCPSWKATRDRIHSPKGRASLMREWLRLQSDAGIDVVEESRKKKSERGLGFLKHLPGRIRNSLSREQHHDFSHQVYDAMAGCLSCKSCAGQCPVKVNVPQFRSQFLEVYHGRYLRPLRDYVIGATEFTLPWLAKAAPLYNAVIEKRWMERLMRRAVGMSDSPTLSRASVKKQLRAWGVAEATPTALALLTERQRARSVILVQDAFTTHMEADMVLDVVELLSRLEYRVFVMPYAANGKPLQVQGFLGAFERTAEKQAKRLRALAEFEIPFVGIDPAMTLTYRQEYVKALGVKAVPQVLLLQEWLATRTPSLASLAQGLEGPRFKLLSHCTEKTNAPGSPRAWQQVFAAFGLELDLLETGCCGMSGTYGHETRNVATSKAIYAQSWQPEVEAEKDPATLLATGYSCRSQVKRYSDTALAHPLQALLKCLRERRSGTEGA
ncbi:(Fe-S)-binding protein, partial [Halomonas sp. 707D4]|uniref:(Fe-S)-binding protein n=1 Tax=Halomonas sp. 707D4 TaxID=1904455 RepID=UPI0026465127